LPTISSVLLIVAGPQSFINKKFLSNPILVWIGLISFPLYLWHWPLISFAKIILGDLSVEIRFILILLSLFLGWVTYQYVEKNIRKRKYVVWKVSLLIILMVIIGIAGWNIHKREGLEFRYRKMMVLKPDQKRDFSKWEDKGMYPTGQLSTRIYLSRCVHMRSNSFE
jgi:hypothetical protein